MAPHTIKIKRKVREKAKKDSLLASKYHHETPSIEEEEEGSEDSHWLSEVTQRSLRDVWALDDSGDFLEYIVDDNMIIIIYTCS